MAITGKGLFVIVISDKQYYLYSPSTLSAQRAKWETWTNISYEVGKFTLSISYEVTNFTWPISYEVVNFTLSVMWDIFGDAHVGIFPTVCLIHPMFSCPLNIQENLLKNQ